MDSRIIYEPQSDSSVDFQQQDGAGQVHRALFNDLVEIVPLVQSLIDGKANSSFTRRGSISYTKMPSRDSLYKKAAGKSVTKPNKKNKDQGGANDQGLESGSALSSKGMFSEKDREELLALRDQVEDLKRHISEKDELLKSAELSKIELASICEKYDELMNEVAEKESMIKRTQLQLSDAKIKLADKQAAVEKLEWEAMTSMKKVETLQKDLDSSLEEIQTFVSLIQGLARENCEISGADYDDVPYFFDQDNELEETDMDQHILEEAREAYIAALAVAKEKQDEESIAYAANTRFYLQSIALKQS